MEERMKISSYGGRKKLFKIFEECMKSEEGLRFKRKIFI
jgi:hypothetical protein